MVGKKADLDENQQPEGQHQHSRPHHQFADDPHPRAADEHVTKVKWKKPHAEIFRQALESAGCRAEEALFVGDSRSADVAGANAAGLHSVLLWQRTDRSPPDEDPRPRHVISEIPEVLGLLG